MTCTAFEGFCKNTNGSFDVNYRCIGMKVQYEPPCCVFNGVMELATVVCSYGVWVYVEECMWCHKMAGFWKSFVDLVLFVGS